MDDLEEVLFTQEQIQERCKQVAAQLDKDLAFAQSQEGDKPNEIVFICILKGAFNFMASLVNYTAHVPILEFMCISSYGASTVSSGNVRIIMDTRISLENKHVVIIEDIVDTGLTLQCLHDLIRARKPASIRTAVLLHKKEMQHESTKGVKLDYVCFDCPNKFVIGFGLDYDERYRTLPVIGVLKPSVYLKGEGH